MRANKFRVPPGRLPNLAVPDSTTYPQADQNKETTKQTL